jgi:hypothetical protein
MGLCSAQIFPSPHELSPGQADILVYTQNTSLSNVFYIDCVAVTKS